MTTDAAFDAALDTWTREYERAAAQVSAAELECGRAAMNLVSFAVTWKLPDARFILLTGDRGIISFTEIFDASMNTLHSREGRSSNPDLDEFLDELPWDALVSDQGVDFWSATIELIAP